MPKNFNVRVYGILINQGRVLVSDEYIKRNKITKFPGGGLEFGEGTKDCLAREFREELQLEITVGDHFYTTDFFVCSSFNTESQVISIYYIVNTQDSDSIIVSETPHNYIKKEGAQSFRWLSLDELKESDMSLIIDRKVVEMLTKEFA